MSSRVTKTADRILDASLKLFNQQGFQNVPALKIAMHLGISPGHLAYHFKTKKDIVLAVLPRLEDEIRREVSEPVKPGQPFRADAAAAHTIAVFRTLWRYRFFFDALNHLLTEDAELRARYLHLQEIVVGTSEQVFNDLIAQGYMRPITPPSTARSLARSWWMMWLGWLSIEQIEHSGCEEAPAEALFEGARLSHGTVQNYFRAGFSEAFLSGLRTTLGLEQLPVGVPKTAAKRASAKAGIGIKAGKRIAG